MAQHRIRLWLQFGVLDLLIVTTVVAVVMALYRPMQTRTSRATPWVFGSWQGSIGSLSLYPDGSYQLSMPVHRVVTSKAVASWTIRPLSDARTEFVLTCQQLRFLIREKSGRDVMDLLDDDGAVRCQLEQAFSFDGPMRNGVPDGTWETSYRPDGVPAVFKYRRGELVDFQYRSRDLSYLNQLRAIGGLPPLSGADFYMPDGTPKDISQ